MIDVSILNEMLQNEAISLETTTDGRGHLPFLYCIQFREINQEKERKMLTFILTIMFLYQEIREIHIKGIELLKVVLTS